MKAALKEKIYLCITFVCLALCGAMIAGMCFNKSDNISSHLPAIRSITEETDPAPGDLAQNEQTEPSAGQIAITEDFLNEQLKRFLPDDFPVKTPEINIGADGIITVSGNIDKENLKTFLKDNNIRLGFKYSAALFLLPATFSAEASLKISEGENGKLIAAPYSLYISGKKVPVSVFPQKVTDMLTSAVNDSVSTVKGLFGFSGFEDGAILFQRN